MRSVKFAAGQRITTSSTKGRIRGLVLATFLLALVAGPDMWRSRAAVNRFVAVGGSDASNDCTNPGNPCATIRNAINQSQPGDLIILGPGLYTENVIVAQTVTIQGDGAKGSTVN